MSNDKHLLPENMVYALDIGTRNVVGIIGEREGDQFKVVDYLEIAHADRTMYDGQIHDIAKVVHTVKKLTETLTDLTGYTLDKVAIAAAGRALKTEKVTITKAVDPALELDKAILDTLEIEGIQQAQKIIEEEASSHGLAYYCVGYSVVRYYLDGAILDNPISHKGRELTLDIIATFLPHSVVNSLYTVVDKAGLSVMNLTLEPIAALNIAIPQKFRLLNIALVDIGAGTSDVALTKEGAIFSYGMVDVAGDELTEALVNAYLLDFETAEHLKTRLNLEQEHVFKDIVGVTHKYSTEEIVKSLKPAIEKLSSAIAKVIIEANGGAPSALFLIGGGSQIPSFSKALAKALELPPERVLIKGAELLEGLHYEKEPLKGPKYITPLGIGYGAQTGKSQDFLHVVVNGSPVKLFNSKKLLVLDALVLLGYNTRRLLPKRGASLIFKLNGKTKRIAGGYGEAAIVKINGNIASLDTPITHGDSIELTPAIEGEDAKVILSDIVDTDTFIYYQDQPYYLNQNIRINGETCDSECPVKISDEITYAKLATLNDFTEYVDIAYEMLLVNGNVVSNDYVLKHEDYITLMTSEKMGTYSKESTPVCKDNQEIKHKIAYHLVINDENVVIHTDSSSLIFVDIFEHIDFDLTKPQGIIDLELNGERARYTDVLKSGDVIKVGWKV